VLLYKRRAPHVPARAHGACGLLAVGAWTRGHEACGAFRCDAPADAAPIWTPLHGLPMQQHRGGVALGGCSAGGGHACGAEVRGEGRAVVGLAPSPPIGRTKGSVRPTTSLLRGCKNSGCGLTGEIAAEWPAYPPYVVPHAHADDAHGVTTHVWCTHTHTHEHTRANAPPPPPSRGLPAGSASSLAFSRPAGCTWGPSRSNSHALGTLFPVSAGYLSGLSLGGASYSALKLLLCATLLRSRGSRCPLSVAVLYCEHSLVGSRCERPRGWRVRSFPRAAAR
jgi:hypothetical protein